MKKVLSLLVAFVFLQVNTWALSGGPDYFKDSNGPNDLVGTYSGVLIPKTSTNLTESTGAASIGLFTVNIPQAGLATGQGIFFIRGTAFTGSLVCFADPDDSSLEGVFIGQSTYEVIIQPRQVFTSPTGAITVIPAVTAPIIAQGNLKAEVIRGIANAFQGGTAGTTSSITQVTTTEVGTNNAARIVGTAELDTYLTIAADGSPNVRETVTFEADGIKQSNTVSTTSSTGFFLFLF